MLPLINYLKMYTLYQCIAVILVILNPKLFPEEVIDIIRGSCIIVASFITYLYYCYGYNRAAEVYKKALLYFIPKELYLLLDFILHYLVIFLIGLPKNPLSILYAGIIFITWFEINKEKLAIIYPTNFTKAEHDYMEYYVLPTIIIFLMLISYIVSYLKIH